MDLGTKIKEVLHTPESNEAARGKVDHTTPGSFPEDDETPLETQHDPVSTTTGSTHNKLHKPNDPRGWTDEEKQARSHGYTDSGVGLTGSHENTLGNEPRDAAYNRDVTATRDTAPIVGGAPVIGMDTARDPTSTTGLASSEPTDNRDAAFSRDPAAVRDPATILAAAPILGTTAHRDNVRDTSSTFDRPSGDVTSTRDPASARDPASTRDTNPIVGALPVLGSATNRDTATSGVHDSSLGRDSDSRLDTGASETTGLSSHQTTGQTTGQTSDSRTSQGATGALGTAGVLGAAGLASHQTADRSSESNTYPSGTTAATAPFQDQSTRSHDTTQSNVPASQLGTGIYNTVQGHGSHEQPNTTTFQHGTGVYNTVQGHGSQDQSNPLASHQTAGHGSEGHMMPSGTASTIPASQDKSNLAHDNSMHSSSTTDPSGTTTAPYWGDLPRGAGVYNTVAGHGSQEDHNRHTDALSKEMQDNTTSSTLGRSHPVDASHQSSGPLGTSLPDRSRDAGQVASNQESSFNKGAAGVAAAGVAGAGAYGLNKNEPGNLDRENRTDATDSKHQDNEKDSKILGIFPRGSKDEHKDKHGTDHKEHKHDDKAKDDHKEGMLAGLLHRGSEKKKDTDNERKDTATQDRGLDSSTTAGLAATGAGGLATTAALNRHEDRSTVDQSQHPAMRGNDGATNTSALGTASAIPTRTDAASPSSVYSSDPVTSTNPGKTNYDGVGFASAATAGLGAGTLASRELGQRDSEQNQGLATQTSSNNPASSLGTGNLALSDLGQSDRQRKQDVTTETSSSFPASSTHSAFAAAPLTAFSGLTKPTESMAATGSTSVPTNESSTNEAVPSLTEAANHGEYNHLASGTPSGIKVDNESSSHGAGPNQI